MAYQLTFARSYDVVAVIAAAYWHKAVTKTPNDAQLYLDGSGIVWNPRTDIFSQLFRLNPNTKDVVGSIPTVNSSTTSKLTHVPRQVTIPVAEFRAAGVPSAVVDAIETQGGTSAWSSEMALAIKEWYSQATSNASFRSARFMQVALNMAATMQETPSSTLAAFNDVGIKFNKRCIASDGKIVVVETFSSGSEMLTSEGVFQGNPKSFMDQAPIYSSTVDGVQIGTETVFSSTEIAGAGQSAIVIETVRGMMEAMR